jgi:rubrerythrin
VLDLLIARCQFEREGVKLYDHAIAKIERDAEPRYHAIIAQLQRIRGEEKEHEEWLESQIRALGGDPRAKSTFSRLESEETQGVIRVIVNGHQQIPHVLHALLAAELADNAGWDLLVKLADEAGDRQAKMAFARRLAEETKHLIFVREALHAAAEIEILGASKKMPSTTPRQLARKAVPIALGLGGFAAAFAAGWSALRMRLRRA